MSSFLEGDRYLSPWEEELILCFWRLAPSELCKKVKSWLSSTSFFSNWRSRSSRSILRSFSPSFLVYCSLIFLISSFSYVSLSSRVVCIFCELTSFSSLTYFNRELRLESCRLRLSFSILTLLSSASFNLLSLTVVSSWFLSFERSPTRAPCVCSV